MVKKSVDTDRQTERKRTYARILGLTGTALATLVLLLWILPALLTRHPSSSLTDADRLKAANDVRTTLIQALAAAGLLGGLFYTARTYRLSLRGQEMTRMSQITERYSSCVEQLGDSNLNVRLGAIYAFERLIHDSPDDEPTIIEVLSAFVREANNGEDLDPPTGAINAKDSVRPEIAQWVKPACAADIQAAMTVLVRRPSHGSGERLNLRRAKLRGLLLEGADLRNAMLQEADLSFASLSSTNLDNANLWGADLTKTGLDGASLQGAYLARARLQSTSFGGAKLKGANFVGAVATEALFLSADLEDVCFREADLRGAMLRILEGVDQYLSDARIADTDFDRARLFPNALSDAQLKKARNVDRIMWVEAEGVPGSPEH
jgi:uncharacterized protein YjbI with pentapeptide repeats